MFCRGSISRVYSLPFSYVLHMHNTKVHPSYFQNFQPRDHGRICAVCKQMDSLS